MDIIKENDNVVIYFSKNYQKLLTIIKNGYTNTHICSIQHNDIINSQYNVHNGKFTVIKPYPSMLISLAPRQTQILFEADISMIMFMLNINKNSRIIEAGSGSGTFTHFLSQLALNGYIYTYEKNEERYNKLNDRMFSKNVILHKKDVGTDGFNQKNIDVIFLDLPEPWDTIEHSYTALKPNGRICVFVPSIEQVICVRDKLNRKFINLRMFENVKNQLVSRFVGSKGTGSKIDQYIHTGFLIFARKNI